MKVFLVGPRGFCAGVVRAIETVERALVLWGSPIYVKHEIVHNRHVVDALRSKGAVFIEDLKDVPVGGRVIYSAHGVSPQVRAEARQRQLVEIDATCGLVTKVHSAVHRYAQKGYHIILIGHRKHVEIQGTAGCAPHATTIIESVADVEELVFPVHQKLFYATQTTLSLDDVREIAAALQQKYPSIETLPTSSICYATSNRQLALIEVLDRVDLALVIGDPTSSNSNRLKEIAAKRGVLAYLVNDPEEISAAWLVQAHAIAVTAGASTPESVVQQCLNKLFSLVECEMEEASFVEETVRFGLPRQVLTVAETSA